jgi:hypothetical protein
VFFNCHPLKSLPRSSPRLESVSHAYEELVATRQLPHPGSVRDTRYKDIDETKSVGSESNHSGVGDDESDKGDKGGEDDEGDKGDEDKGDEDDEDDEDSDNEATHDVDNGLLVSATNDVDLTTAAGFALL